MRRHPQENVQTLYEIAAAQGGYFTAAQAGQAGYAYSQQHYHRRKGSWLRIGGGIYRLRDFPPSEREDLIRWTLWSRNQKGDPQAVVSHETALTVHELSDVMPSKIHLTVPNGFRKQVPSGCMLHGAALTADDIEDRTGYQVTTPLRTLLDAADSALSQEYLNQAVREALGRGLVRRRLLETTQCTNPIRTRLDQALAAAQQEEV